MPALRIHRFFALGMVFIASCVVLGLSANFASLFLPHIHRPYTVYAVVVPAVTCLVLIFLAQRSTPMYDAIMLVILGILWLALAAWSTDVIGHVECFSTSGQQATKNGGSMSAQVYCYEMKSIEAFSWFNFAVLLITLLLLIMLVNQLQSMGRYGAWHEDTAMLPGFGGAQFGGQNGMGYGGSPYGMGQMYGQNGQMPYVIQQAPGHSVVIQPNPGGVPTVAQVPSA